MNCHESRTVLDAAFPNSGIADGSDFEQATAHARTCGECSSWLQSAHAFDRWAAPAFRDAFVPEGLRDRLLQAIEADAQVVTPRQSAKSSRRLWIAAVSAAALLLAAVSWWNVSNIPVEPTAMALADVEEKLDAQSASLSGLPAFDGSFTPALPGGWSRRVSGNPTGIDLDGDGEHDAAVYRFTAGPHSGYLVVTSAGLVSDPPGVTIPHGSHANYQMRRVTWASSGDQVCICYLDANGPRMDEFLSDLYPHSA